MSSARSQMDALNAELAELADDYRFTPDELCERHPLMGGSPEDTLNNIAAVVIVLGDALRGVDDGGCEARDRGHQLLLTALEVAASDHTPTTSSSSRGGCTRSTTRGERSTWTGSGGCGSSRMTPRSTRS